METIFAHATDILKLSASFLLVSLSFWLILCARVLIQVQQLLRKINDVSDVVITYIQKPIMAIMAAEKTFKQVIGFFHKK